MHKCNKRANSIHILYCNFKHKWLWYIQNRDVNVHDGYMDKHFINQWVLGSNIGGIVENSLFMEIATWISFEH